MTSGQRTNDSDDSDDSNDSQKATTRTGESLEELTERTAEVMDDARRKVDRARATLHDQLLSEAPGGEAAYVEYEAEHERDGAEAGDRTPGHKAE